jgi:hypothetical protein
MIRNAAFLIENGKLPVTSLTHSLGIGTASTVSVV